MSAILSDSDDEDLAVFGTALEPLNEDEVPKKKPFTMQDQVVRDKQGRRRFHGAFTGGFSAGFFNSVGSLEGWTPSRFKSSRGAKAQPLKQKAEDFMDEEDMDEFGIAPKMLQTTSDYGSEKKERSKKRIMSYYDGPIPGEPVLRDILQPVRKTIGMKILMKMGWKPGQGVGPRLSKAEKRRTQTENKQKGVKIYGCSLPDQLEKEELTKSQNSANINETDDDEDDSNDDYKDFTFAPDDYEPYIVKPKDNYFGVGYSGLDRKNILSNHIDFFGPSLVMQDKKKKLSIRGQAFGVGALEEEDEDIYAKEDMSQYDFEFDCKSTRVEGKRGEQRLSQPVLAVASSESGSLEGFLQGSLNTIKRTFFPPPKLPHTFDPQHKIKKSRFEDKSTVDNSQRNQGVYGYNLTANERAVLLNELHVENNENITTKNTSQTNTLLNIKNEHIIERSPCGTFKPFAGDTDKQERYEKYLSLKQIGQTEKLKTLQPLNMTEWECEHEKTEFEQASRLFKPLSAEFSDRFVSASQPDYATDPLVAVQRTTDANTEMVNAAKMKMFGSLTRVVIDWIPSNIIYKRFNIAEPSTRCKASITDQNLARPKFSIFNFVESTPFDAHATGRMHEELKSRTNSTSEKSNDSTAVETVTKSEDQNYNKNDILPENVPKLDLYRAIFLSDSEDESESEKDTKPDSESCIINIKSSSESMKHSSSDVSLKTRLQEPDTFKGNILRNASPPRGVFANLDLDAINSRTKKRETTEDIRNKPVAETDGSKIITESEKMRTAETKNESHLIYGPQLPSVFPDKIVSPKTRKSQSSIHAGSDSEWIELRSETKHKHKKKHSKKLHKKNKKHKDIRKHKHKKKKK